MGERRWNRSPTVADGWVPEKHGIPSSYNRGCRCAECRACNAARVRVSDAKRSQRQREKAARIVDADGYLVHPDPIGGHGTTSAYSSSACRCGPCRAASAQYLRDRKR